MKIIYIRADTYALALEHIRDGKKIKAIKVVRNDSGCLLREAKLGIENLGARISDCGPAAKWPTNFEFDFACRPLITKVGILCGEGEIMVDIEEAQFYVMRDLGKVPLGEIRRLSKFLEKVEEFSRGYPIEE